MFDGYSPEVLNSLRQAFNAVWETFNAQVPVSAENETELQIQLSRALLDLASDGITDPADLRRKALESMALNPR